MTGLTLNILIFFIIVMESRIKFCKSLNVYGIFINLEYAAHEWLYTFSVIGLLAYFYSLCVFFLCRWFGLNFSLCWHFFVRISY